MSWRVFEVALRNGQVFDVDVINRNFHAIGEELSNLNEHNFAANVAAKGNCEPDVCHRIWKRHTDVDFVGQESTTGSELPYSTSWAVIPNMVLRTNRGGAPTKYDNWIETRGGILTVWASFNVSTDDSTSMPQNPASTTVREVETAYAEGGGPGLHFAIEVDGTPFYDSLVGSGDLGNDVKDDGQQNLYGEAIQRTSMTAPCVKGWSRVITVTLNVRVTPGKHIVRAVYRNIGQLSVASNQRVNTREIIGIENWE